jgi:hypothetical protein
VNRRDVVDADRRTTNPDANPDPITGAPGSHPVGTGVGAAAAGAAGAAIGSVIPGVGTVAGGVVGAVVGSVAGGLVGKGVAEGVNPSVENEYWRENYASRPYVATGSTYEEYEPAYRYGWESRARYPDRSFDEAHGDLSSGWDKFKGKSKLEWDKAKLATRDAWNRVEDKFSSHRSHADDMRSTSAPSTANPSTRDVMTEPLNDPDRSV